MKALLLAFLISIFGISSGQLRSEDFPGKQAVEIPGTLADSVQATDLSSERVLSFHSDIVIDKNGEVTVTEKIKAVALGIDIRRGIYRSLPIKRNLNGRTYDVDYEVISVKRNGEDEGFRTEYGSGYQKIYLGKKDYLLPKGIYEYELKFKTSKQIGFFKDYDEFYWNVNGNAWSFPVDKISTTVTLPEGADIIQNSCYTGAYGSSKSNCTFSKISQNEMQWSAKKLRSGEGLTVAVGFKKGVFAPPPPPTFFEKYGILLIGFFTFLGLMAYYFRTWQKHGRDPEKPVIYPQFNVPENFSPASLGYINKESFKTNFVTSSLVNLAIKGFIRIEEHKREGLLAFGKSNYHLKKLKDPDELLPLEEKKLMNALFSGRDTVKMDGRYDSKIEGAVAGYKKIMEDQYDKFLNEGNNRSKLLIPALVIIGVYALLLYLAYHNYPDVGKLLLGCVIFMVLTPVFLVGLYFKKINILQRRFFIIPVFFFLFFAGNLYFSLDFTDSGEFNLAYVFIVIAFTSMMIYQFLIRRPSEEKLRQQSLIEGFKMYMGAAENEQIKFHNPPQMTQQVFERLLPYAMVLDVDKIWGEKFQNMLVQTAAAYTSSWYVGNYAFNSNFGNMLNSSFSKSIQSSSTQPSSSSSGSGGGGFSGGGGGGGGGGGW